MPTRRTRQGVLEQAKFLASVGEPHALKATNGNYELVSDTISSFSRKGGNYTKAELGFIKRVKNYVNKNNIKTHPDFEAQYTKHDVDYIMVSKQRRGAVHRDVVEVDITGS